MPHALIVWWEKCVEILLVSSFRWKSSIFTVSQKAVRAMVWLLPAFFPAFSSSFPPPPLQEPGPLCLLFAVPGKLFPLPQTWLTPHPSGRGVNIISLGPSGNPASLFPRGPTFFSCVAAFVCSWGSVYGVLCLLWNGRNPLQVGYCTTLFAVECLVEQQTHLQLKIVMSEWMAL